MGFRLKHKPQRDTHFPIQRQVERIRVNVRLVYAKGIVPFLEPTTLRSPSKPVKGHRPRILTVSIELIRRLEQIMSNNNQRIFNQFQLERAFYYKRKTTAYKMANPRLLEITFTTFRHWFGTMEYHRTKDILHVQRLLGHKNTQNTLIYIDLEAKLFNNISDGFTVRVAHNVGEATSLIEVGFEYVTGEYNDGGKIFRKRN